jgi:hypothetical protein
VWAILTKDRFPVGEYNKLAACKVGPIEIIEIKISHVTQYFIIIIVTTYWSQNTINHKLRPRKCCYACTQDRCLLEAY